MPSIKNNPIRFIVVIVLMVFCVSPTLFLTHSVTATTQDEVRVKKRFTIMQIWDLSTSGLHIVDVYLNGAAVETTLKLSENARVYLHTLNLRLRPGRNIVTVKVKRASNLALNLPVRFPDYKYGSPCDVKLHIETRGSGEGSILVWAP